MTLLAAIAGAFTAVRRAVSVPPAEAMRPDVPTRYRRSFFETPVISRHLGTAGRMVLRNVMRHPLRAAASVFGIAFWWTALSDRCDLGRELTSVRTRIVETYGNTV